MVKGGSQPLGQRNPFPFCFRRRNERRPRLGHEARFAVSGVDTLNAKSWNADRSRRRLVCRVYTDHGTKGTAATDSAIM